MKPRCLTLFEESCRSEATRRSYLYELNVFLKWAHKDYESVLLIPDDQLKIILEDYALYLKRRYVKLSIKLKIAALSKFFFINDRVINSKKLLLFLPEDNKRGGDRAITREEIKDILINCGMKRTKAIIHILSSTGARPEAITELRLRDVADLGDSKSILFYAGSIHEYYGFLHKEASKALNQYLDQRVSKGEYLKPESFLFRPQLFIITEKKPLGITVNNLQGIIKDAMKEAGIGRIKTGNRYDLAVCTGFRKRFDTIVKSSNQVSFAIGERLMDHKNNLESNYFRPTRDQLFENFTKIIPELIINDENILKEAIEMTKNKEEDLRGTALKLLEKLLD